MQKKAVTKVAELDKEAHCVHQDTPLFVAIRKHSDCLLLNEDSVSSCALGGLYNGHLRYTLDAHVFLNRHYAKGVWQQRALETHCVGTLYIF